MERFGPFDEKRDCRRRRHGPVLDAFRHDEELSRVELNIRTLRELNAESALPAEKELVFIVLMPDELSFELRQTDNGVVRSHEVDRRPRAGDGSRSFA